MTDDVRLSRFFSLGSERVRLQILGEAFNVTNRVNFISLRTTQYNFTGAAFAPVANFFTPAPGSSTGDRESLICCQDLLLRRGKLPTGTAGNPLKRPDQFVRDPAAVNSSGLRLDMLAVDIARNTLG